MKYCDNCKRIETTENPVYLFEYKATNLVLCLECYNQVPEENKGDLVYIEYEEIPTYVSRRKEKKDYDTIDILNLFVIFVPTFLMVLYSFNITCNYFDKVRTDLQGEIDNIVMKINETNIDINNAKIEKEQQKIYYEENVSAIKTLKTVGNEYYLRQPLYSEVDDFIEKDKSSSEKELISNAKKQGFRCAYCQVYVIGYTIKEYSGYGLYYILIAFDTLDKGIVYFETDNDCIMHPVIGKKYRDCYEENYYWSYYDVNLDDTITKIEYVW